MLILQFLEGMWFPCWLKSASSRRLLDGVNFLIWGINLWIDDAMMFMRDGT